jgi:transposase
MAAGCFVTLVDDLRKLRRLAANRNEEPSTAILDGRTLQSSTESSSRAGYDGTKRKRGSKTHLAVDMLGHLLRFLVTPANEQERAQVCAIAEQIQEASGESVTTAFVDQGYTGESTAQAAKEHGINFIVVKLQEAKKGFVLLPKRWVVERSFARTSRFRRLVKDYERLEQTLPQLHYVVFAILMLVKLKPYVTGISP